MVYRAAGHPERSRDLLQGPRKSDFIMPAATVVGDAVTPRDVAELARDYAGEGGWSGALALYGSMLREAEAIRAIAKDVPLTIPTMAIDRTESDYTLQKLQAVHRGRGRAHAIEGVGHYIAMEAPEKLAAALLAFFGAPSFEANL